MSLENFNHLPETEKTPPPAGEPGGVETNLRPQFQLSEFELLAGIQFRRGPAEPRRRWQIVLWSWLASLIDGLFLIGLSFLGLALAALTTGAASSSFLSFDLTQNSIWIVALMAFSYLVLMRSFTGFTLGEWACGLRLGLPWERQDSKYILKTMFRSFIVVSTGLITLPLLSLFFSSDLAGEASSLHLMSLK